MAIFKMLHGDDSNVSLNITPFHEGWVYITSSGYYYVDLNIGTAESPNNQRIKLNAGNAETLCGKSLEEIKTEIMGDIDIPSDYVTETELNNIRTAINNLNNTKLDSSELNNAITDALAQAKSSGEFDGKDGTSVTVSSVDTSTADGGSNVVTFSDGKTLTVKNGNKGSNGTSTTHSWNGTTLTVTSASGTSSADLKGDKGDKGDDGIAQVTSDGTGDLVTSIEYDTSTKIFTVKKESSLPTALKNPKKLTFGDKTYDGSEVVSITAADLGLDSAMKYIGATTTILTDGATTNPITINNNSVTATNGNVTLYESKEFIWNGTSWEIFGDEGNLASKSYVDDAISSAITMALNTAV